MTIHLPPELESSIRAEVLSGHFASEHDMVAAAVRDYLRRQQQPSPSPAGQESPAAQESPAHVHKPIWEVIEEENRSIPPEVWDALPTDLAEQHDHYIYGTPKRPTR